MPGGGFMDFSAISAKTAGAVSRLAARAPADGDGLVRGLCELRNDADGGGQDARVADRQAANVTPEVVDDLGGSGEARFGMNDPADAWREDLSRQGQGIWGHTSAIRHISQK